MPAPKAVSTSSAKKEKGGWRSCTIIGCLVVLALPLLGLFGFMMLGFVGAMGMAAGGQNNQVIENVVEPGDSSSKIVVLDVHGILFGGKPQPFSPQPLTTRLLQELDNVENDDDVVAVVLDMNTPGGEVTATDEVYHKIQQLREEKGIKFITCMRTVAASGGYYLAAGTDHIVANRLSLTGSIGVIMGGINFSGLLEEHGVKSEVYTSGRYKDFLNMTRERQEYEREYVQGMIDDMFDEFAQIVATGRDMDIETVRSFEAKVFTGKQALENQLVDELGYMDDAVAAAKELSGDSNAMVVRYQAFPSFGGLLFGAHSRESGMDALARRLAPRTQRGVPYYLLPMAE
jgi:protease-4